MRKITAILVTVLSSLVAASLLTVADATERWHGSPVKFVYPLGSGDFVLGFDTDSAQCANSNSPKYMYVAIGQNGVTAEGASKLYAAALLALAMKTTLSLAFDDATSFCYINRFSVQN